MWDFDGDEFLFLIVSAFFALAGLAAWYRSVLQVPWVPTRHRAVLCTAPVVGLSIILAVLKSIADPVYVVGHFDYELLFLAGGMAWVFILGRLGTVLVGQPSLVDTLETRNPASVAVWAGGVLGVALAYAGSNVGYGPTIWTTIVPAAVATIAFFALGGVMELASNPAEAIAVDRDVACGVRVGALMLVNGAVLGRAMAGDWKGWHELFETFARLGWPAAVFTLVISTLNYVARPSPRRPKPGILAWGIAPATLLLACTAAYLVSLGHPEVAPAAAHGGHP
jgi:hypothetical protein